MKSLILFLLYFTCSQSLYPAVAFAEVSGKKSQNEEPVATLLNINKLSMWIRSDGLSARNPYWQSGGTAIPWGIVYPRGMPVGLVFADGFVWGGIVNDGQQPELRVGGHNWGHSVMQPGAILSAGVAEDPNGPHVNRVWRYRSDWETADLEAEAYDILISKPEASSQNFQFSQQELSSVADSLRMAYENDLENWPWEKGAPFYDSNNNGIMDENEQPGLLNAAQVVWFVANDLDSEKSESVYGSPSIGLEMQVTLWAYNHDNHLENSIYRRIRLIYKGTEATPVDASIDSMAVGVYSEVDIGDFVDDFGGTDTTLQMVFGYNSTTLDPVYREIDSSPPALGYRLFYGPLVPGTGEDDFALFDFHRHDGVRNLHMTGSWIDKAGDSNSQPNVGTYNGTLQYYNVLNGFRPRPESPPDPFRNPFTEQETRFTITGDPVQNTGWVDENPGNRQITLTIGNFKMALGDTQEVVLIMTAGLGADRLASVDVMKFFSQKAREFAEYNFVTSVREPERTASPKSFQLYQNFPNPFNPGTTIRYDLSADAHVKLSVFNLLGESVRTLVDEKQKAGTNYTAWDGLNADGNLMPSGVYFFKIKAGKQVQTRKMILMK